MTKKLIRPCFRPIFRKCFHTAYYFLDYPPRNVPTLQEWENTEQDGERTAVSVENFVTHVAALHADGDIGFSKEYEIIQAETGDYTVENSQFAENKTKNRYLNILACKLIIDIFSKSNQTFLIVNNYSVRIKVKVLMKFLIGKVNIEIKS